MFNPTPSWIPPSSLDAFTVIKGVESDNSTIFIITIINNKLIFLPTITHRQHHSDHTHMHGHLVEVRDVDLNTPP